MRSRPLNKVSSHRNIPFSTPPAVSRHLLSRPVRQLAGKSVTQASSNGIPLSVANSVAAPDRLSKSPDPFASASSSARQVVDLKDSAVFLDGDDGMDMELDDDTSYNLAVVDMGSNSFHLVVVKADASGRYQVLDSMKEEVKLLSGGTRFNIITEEAEARALATMKRLRQIAETRGAEMRAVATSAIREARNGGVLVRRIRDQVGTNVEVISGQEEARLIYLGVLQALPSYNKRLLCIDIGGGSTEVAVGHQGSILCAKSVKLGHLRCMDLCYPTLVKQGTINLGEVRDCRSHTSAVLADSGLREEIAAQRRAATAAGEEFVAVGSSGNVVTIAKVIAARRQRSAECGVQHQEEDGEASTRQNGISPPQSQLWRGDLAQNGTQCQPDSFGDLEFTKAELHTLVCDLLESNREERGEMECLKATRIDTIVAGAVLLQELFILLGIDRMKVSSFALREGMIADTLARVLPHSDKSFVQDPRCSSLKHLSKRFNLQMHYESSKHVSHLAKQLLEGLLSSSNVSEPLKLLTPNDAFLLEGAALVHHVGMFLSHSDCHDHAYYIIKHDSHLLGFTPLELEMVALMCKFHRKSYPDPAKHPEVAALPPDEAVKLNLLVALLRVALALDRRRTASSVKRVTVEQDADSAVILVEAATITPRSGSSPSPSSNTPPPSDHDAVHDIALELWAARQELAHLSHQLQTAVSIIEGGEASMTPATVNASQQERMSHSALMSALLDDDLPSHHYQDDSASDSDARAQARSQTVDLLRTGDPEGRGEKEKEKEKASTGHAMEWNMHTDTDGRVDAFLGSGNGIHDGDNIVARMDGIDQSGKMRDSKKRGPDHEGISQVGS